MRILVSNDDGIYSPGLAALAAVAARFGEVRIVAPDVEQSSMSHAITSSRPLSYRRTPIASFEGKYEAYRVNGTPADCVALGAHSWDGIDVVLSGINLGTNLGSAVWHSGTLAAAKQAALLGLRGIAFSTPVGESEPDFPALAPWVEKTLRMLLEVGNLPLVNVNIPKNPQGLCWTRQSVQHYDGKVAPGTDPMGRQHYWYTVIPIDQVEEGTDRWAMGRNYVSVTPLRLDLTDDELLQQGRTRLGCSDNGAAPWDLRWRPGVSGARFAPLSIARGNGNEVETLAFARAGNLFRSPGTMPLYPCLSPIRRGFRLRRTGCSCAGSFPLPRRAGWCLICAGWA